MSRTIALTVWITVLSVTLFVSVSTLFLYVGRYILHPLGIESHLWINVVLITIPVTTLVVLIEWINKPGGFSGISGFGMASSNDQFKFVEPLPGQYDKGKPRSGLIFWNPPNVMRVGRQKRIEVRLGDAEIALDEFKRNLQATEDTEQNTLELSPFMRTKLIARSREFTIEEISNPDQHIQSGRVARWDFNVKPKIGGTRELRLLVSMRIPIASRIEFVDLPSYEKWVRVRRAPLRVVVTFLKTNWKWLSTSIGIPLISWLALSGGLGDKVSHLVRLWLV